MITPAISVLSAVEGLKVASRPRLDSLVVPIAVGDHRRAVLRRSASAPAASGGSSGRSWSSGSRRSPSLGVRRIAMHPEVLGALPELRLRLPRSTAARPASSRSAPVVLAITGAEALYADMGHFGRAADPRAPGSASSSPALHPQLPRPGRADPATTRARISNPFFLLVPQLGPDPDGGPGDRGHGDRLAGGDLRRLLDHPPGGAARLPARACGSIHTSSAQFGQIYVPSSTGCCSSRFWRWCWPSSPRPSSPPPTASR